MKIDSVTAINVRGRDFSHKLGPVTVLSGDNFSGKTAILDAIRIGLLGYHSKLGKQGSKLWKLAGGTRMEMSVQLDFPDGQRIFNQWIQKPDGTISLNSDIPDALQTPAVLLDANEYFNRTSAERIAFIFEKLDPASLGFSEASIVEKISAIEVIPAILCREVLPGVIKTVQTSISQRQASKTTLQTWMAELLEEWRSKKKTADQLKKGAASLVSGNKGKPGPVPKDVSDALAAKEIEWQGILKRLEAIQAELDRMAKHKNQILELSTTAAIKEIEETVTVEEIEKLKASQKPTIDLKTENTKLGQLRQKSTDLKAKIQELEKAISKLEAETKKHLAGKACPTCKSKGEAWKKALEEETNVEVELMRKDIAQFTRESEATITEGVKLKTSIEAKEKANQIEKDIALSLKQLESELTLIRSQNAKVASAREQLATLQSSGSGVDTSEQPALRAQEARLCEEIKVLRQEQQAFIVHQAARAKMQEAEKDSLRYQVEIEICKQAIAILIESQEEVIAKAFDGILTKARAFTDGILRAPLAYRDGDFGMDTPEGWVSSDVFSGLEQALSYAALCVALAQNAPIKVVLMDELGILSPAFKKKVLRRMVELAGNGIIDQFIAADATPLETMLIVDKSLTIINV